jgi:uncharacterized protein (DUF1684 family)
LRPKGPKAGWTLVAGLFLLPALACTSGPPPPVSARPPAEDIQAWRLAKDEMFRSTESPLPPGERASFTGLPYYPIDPAWRVPARLLEDRGAKPVIIELENSKRQREPLRKVGQLKFTLAGGEHLLTAFAPADARTITRLFVPFGDLTNGKETYGGGRYLELDRMPSGQYEIDFNRAFHPFCVFNIDYVCPVPPLENRLPIAIPAGERLRR